MKGEFDENLGHVNYITTYRDSVVLIYIPIKKYNHLVLIPAERNVNTVQIVNYTRNFFEISNVFGIEITDTLNEDSILSVLQKKLQM